MRKYTGPFFKKKTRFNIMDVEPRVGPIAVQLLMYTRRSVPFLTFVQGPHIFPKKS